MQNLRNAPQGERLKRIDGFWSEGSYYLPEDFMSEEQGDAYLDRLEQTINGINLQFSLLRGGSSWPNTMPFNKP